MMARSKNIPNIWMLLSSFESLDWTSKSPSSWGREARQLSPLNLQRKELQYLTLRGDVSGVVWLVSR